MPLRRLVFIVFVVGCAHGPYLGRSTTGRDPTRLERYALQRAASDLQCGPDELVVDPLGASGFRVDGCGRSQSYNCIAIPNSWSVLCNPILVAQPVAPPVFAVATTPAPPPQAIVPPPPAGPEVAAARAAIDAHGGGVLACNGGAAVAVDAVWDSSGRLVVAVVGHAGTAEEQCVQATLASTAVSPAGAGGHVIHAVEPH